MAVLVVAVCTATGANGPSVIEVQARASFARVGGARYPVGAAQSIECMPRGIRTAHLHVSPCGMPSTAGT
ncbi:MAG: hypothetical protein AUI36_29485 [Cyanobacteria bacterium 13_1_40CM_2_61_4]|nr:MAG: hypothetical protein AUI36_29485 [Cyanobacteria bacterium 13_1_40CM_2_61_4]